jgi:hypothetical protein
VYVPVRAISQVNQLIVERQPVAAVLAAISGVKGQEVDARL